MNLEFLKLLAARLATEWQRGDDEVLEHIKDASGPEAAFLAVEMLRLLAKSSTRKRAEEFIEALEELVSD